MAGILDYSRQNPWVGDSLQTLSQVLLALGTKEPALLNQIPQMLANRGQQRFENNRQTRQDERTQKLFDMQVAEQERTLNKEKAASQAFQGLLGGVQPPNGMSQAQFGGAPTSQGILSGYSPEQASFLKSYGATDPMGAMGMVGEELFKDAPEYDPKVAGGMYLDPITRQWSAIPGYEDQQTKIRAAGKNSTTVNMGSTGIDYGDPEAGLAWSRNPDGTVKLDERGAPIAVPYQGGKAYIEAQKVDDAKATAGEQKQQTADIVTKDIDRALALMDSAILPTTGIAGSYLSQVGGTAANDVRALVDTVKANVGFDKLQSMRQSSPTGGALGAVTERELALLQSTLGNLEQSQTSDQFKDNLKRVKDIYLDIIHGPGNRPGGGADLKKKYGLD